MYDNLTRTNLEFAHREAEKRIADLEQENAELKEELKDANEKVVHLACNQNKDLKYKLAKAKEILQLFLKLKITPCASGNSINMFQFENVCNQAEQFLKEIEK